ncbi:MAG: MATE family efflux transporter [Pseudomonadota bacterium]
MADRDLTKGSIAKHLMMLTSPMVVGVLSVMSIAIADSYFLGLVSSTHLAAISVVYPVSIVLSSLGIGLSAGANALVSQAIGSKSGDDKVLSAHSVGIAFGCALLFTGLMYLAYPVIFSLMNAEGEVLELINMYVPIWLASFPPLILMMVLNACMRARGSTFIPASLMVLSAVMNIALNPLLIFGWGPVPALDMAGAAWSTLIARSLAVLAFVGVIIFWKRIFTLGCFVTGSWWRSGKDLANVGAIAAMSNAVNPLGRAIITGFVASLGEDLVAGFGAASRIQSLAIVPLLALSGSISAVVGQNWGAGEKERVSRSVVESSAFCIGYGLVVATFLLFSAEWIAGFFSDKEQVIAAAAQYMRWVSWSFLGYGILICINSSMNARGRPIPSFGVGLARVFAVYVPLAWLLQSALGYSGVLIAAIAANFFGATANIWVASRYGVLQLKALPNLFHRSTSRTDRKEAQANG